MTTYAVEFTKSARKEIRKLNPDIALRLAKAINQLAQNPRKGSVRPMVGSKAWRLRVGSYRVIYDIQDKKLVILIIKIAHPADIYKK